MAKMRPARFAAPVGGVGSRPTGPWRHQPLRLGWTCHCRPSLSFYLSSPPPPPPSGIPSEIPRSRLSGRRRYAWLRGQSLPPNPQVPLHGLLTRSVCSCMLQPCPVFFHLPQRPSVRATPHPPTTGPAVAAALLRPLRRQRAPPYALPSVFPSCCAKPCAQTLTSYSYSDLNLISNVYACIMPTNFRLLCKNYRVYTHFLYWVRP